MTTTKRFTTKLTADERGRVRIVLPFDPHQVWGKRPRHHVTGMLAGVAFDTSVAERRGTFFFPVARSLQGAAGVVPGDEVEVVLCASEATSAAAPRELEAALARAPQARAFFDGLTAFARNQWIRWIEAAKREETRAARVLATVEALAAGKKLPRG